MGRCSCELEVVFRSRVEHSYQFHSLPTNLAWQIFTKIFRYSVLLALNFPMPFLCPQAPLQNYIPVSGQSLSTDTCSHEMISSSCSSDASDSQFLSHELACELVFISLGILKFTSECRKINTSKKKDLTWESWSWGRKLFQRAGSSYCFPTKQYFIIPTLRERSSWCRAVKEVFDVDKHYHLFLLTSTKRGHRLQKFREKLRCEQEMPTPSEIRSFPSCLEKSIQF